MVQLYYYFILVNVITVTNNLSSININLTVRNPLFQVSRLAQKLSKQQFLDDKSLELTR